MRRAILQRREIFIFPSHFEERLWPEFASNKNSRRQMSGDFWDADA
jgi:hypothetical protein